MDDFTVVHDDNVVITKERYDELIKMEKNLRVLTEELQNLNEIFDFFGENDDD
jgi:hypothetical protein